MIGLNHSPRLFDSVRRFADTGLAAIQNRVELFALEFREEESRAIEILAWSLAALLFGMLTLVVFTAAIVLLFQPEVRAYVAAGFCVLYLVATLVAVMGLKSRVHNRPPPFSETVDQMKKDREWLTK